MTSAICMLALAACASVQVANDEAPVRVSSLDDRLRSLTVADDNFYRPVLYTWTTPEALADVRKTRHLLVATASSGQFTSPFNRSLATLARGTRAGAPIARLLATHPKLIRRRYAWPAPFATVMGVGRRTYGNALIRIELRPHAWIGRFDPSAPEPFTFVDASGAYVDATRVLAEPERIGAIFHVRTEPTLEVRFREYVVCSTAMIASWSVATPDIRAELDAEVALLRAMREWVAILPDDETTLPASSAWKRTPVSADPAVLWRSVLAFDNRRYQPRQRQLDAILAALADYDPAGEPLVVE